MSSELWSTYRPRSSLFPAGFYFFVTFYLDVPLFCMSDLLPLFFRSHTLITLTTPVTSSCYLFSFSARFCCQVFLGWGKPGRNGDLMENKESRGTANLKKKKNKFLLSLWISNKWWWMTESSEPYFAGKLKRSFDLNLFWFSSKTDGLQLSQDFGRWSQLSHTCTHAHTHTHTDGLLMDELAVVGLRTLSGLHLPAQTPLLPWNELLEIHLIHPFTTSLLTHTHTHTHTHSSPPSPSYFKLNSAQTHPSFLPLHSFFFLIFKISLMPLSLEEAS